jgi:hypothetical protein
VLESSRDGVVEEASIAIGIRRHLGLEHHDSCAYSGEEEGNI